MKPKAVQAADGVDLPKDGGPTRRRPPAAMKFVIGREANGRWYWDLRSLDGQAVAKCSMGFAEKAQAYRDIEDVRQSASRSLVFDPLGNLIGAGSI